MKSQGFSLVWALVLAAVLAVVAASLIQTASTNNRSVQAVSQGTLREIERRNLLTYSQRLLEANTGTLLRTLNAPATGTAGLVTQLQNVADSWCTRDPDGQGTGRVRVHFASQACGAGLPNGVTLPPARLSTANNLSTLEVPFVLVAGSRTQRGTLRARYGTAPASVYALLSASDLTLDSELQIDGSVHSDGQIELMGRPSVTTTLSASGCAVVSTQCVGERRIWINGQRHEVMGLLPSPAHPLGLAATLSLGQRGETEGLSPLNLSGLTAVATRITLGVLESGEQQIEICGAGCVTYVGLESGDLALSSGEVVVPNWNGVLGVSSLGAGITLAPRSPDAPSIVRPLSIVTTGKLTIDGSLTYAQTSCAGDVCNTTGANQFLSVQASDIDVSSQTVRVHGVLIAPRVTRSASLTVFGAVIGTPRGHGILRIQEDPRSQVGQAAPGVPTLLAQWRQGEVDMAP